MPLRFLLIAPQRFAARIFGLRILIRFSVPIVPFKTCFHFPYQPKSNESPS